MDLDYQTILMKSQKKGSYNKGKRKSNPLKVVYISSPMKVKTSASKFRSLVQHLTGKNSDISRYVDDENNMNGFHEICFDESNDRVSLKEGNEERQVLSSISSMDNTSTSSESYLGHMDNVFGSHQMEQFDGIFSSFFEPSELDVLGSYDDLLL